MISSSLDTPSSLLNGRRAGANPFRVVNQLRNKLKMNAAAVQVPIGAESDFRGVVDIVRMKAIYNEGTKG